VSRYRRAIRDEPHTLAATDAGGTVSGGVLAPGLPSFAAYVDELRQFAVGAARDGLARRDRSRVWAELDGNAGAVFRRQVALGTRRDAGTFFTGHRLARRLVAAHASDIRNGASVSDPACGLGDLLLAAAGYLPIRATLAETLAAWGEQLRGRDVHDELVTTAKIRLYLLALARGASPGPAPEPGDAFPLLTREDFLQGEETDEAQVVLLNPPYGRVQAPATVEWATGSVSAAAIFTERALERLAPDARLSAILPDVLRSGTRYEAWRARIESIVRPESIRLVGQFDAATDVDVFLLRARRDQTGRRASWWQPPALSQAHVKDFFDVSVGSVVPHRHPDVGPSVAYVHSRLLPSTGVHRTGDARRGFSGRTVSAPFVAIRRTSRPARHGPRLVTTIVVGDEPIAVENHLLVARPLDGTLTACSKLVAILRSDVTSDWLDQRIRCRHLTVGAVQALPWSER
jgi:hypothetical protein